MPPSMHLQHRATVRGCAPCGCQQQQSQQLYNCHAAGAATAAPRYVCSATAKRPRNASSPQQDALQQRPDQQPAKRVATQRAQQPPQLDWRPQRRPVRIVDAAGRLIQQAVSTGTARSPFQQAVSYLQSKLSNYGHMFVGATAAQLQGAKVPNSYSNVELLLQWDHLATLHETLTLEQLQPSPIAPQGRGQLGFMVQLRGATLLVSAERNTVVNSKPDRLLVFDSVSKQQFWCESLLSVRSRAQPDLAAAVDARLQEMQAELTASNAEAWSHSAAEGAWQARLGTPEDTARWICQDPWLRLGRSLFKHLPEDLSGLKVINLMGSHGTKAIAAAVLGAEATCIDISPVNAAYGAKVAAAAGVQVNFVVADVLQLPAEQLTGTYDVVLLEMGVLHYFIDLAPLFAAVRQLLKPGGRLLLREFHPVSTKLIKGKGKKDRVDGNYFSQQLVVSSVAYSKHLDAGGSKQSRLPAAGGEGPAVRLRQWALGEVVTAVCGSGLIVQVLEEEATVKAEDWGLPKLFTLVAVKA